MVDLMRLRIQDLDLNHGQQKLATLRLNHLKYSQGNDDGGDGVRGADAVPPREPDVLLQRLQDRLQDNRGNQQNLLGMQLKFWVVKSDIWVSYSKEVKLEFI